MAVRDVDDIIAVEHLNKINEKKKARSDCVKCYQYALSEPY